MTTREAVQRPDPPSPCVDVCALDATGRFCLGCLRTLDEIAGWGGFSAAQKHAVLRELETRARSTTPGAAAAD